MGKPSTSTELKIAVTGHRFIDSNQILLDSINSIIHELLDKNIGIVFFLYSALAEGSDQLVAELALLHEEIQLIVPLPIPSSEYLDDFETHVGIQKFTELVQSAHRIIQLPDQPNHESAYQFLGEYLVQECDIIIAIWNGEFSQTKGGTGEVVKFAIEKKKPVYWIYSNQLDGVAINSLKDKKQIGEVEYFRDA
ncbi:MAG: hypothetical protein Q7U53_17960 [Anaerolineaceae bacterium]|nr:hypothetical protein [Anaerolineaceae bacterium]